MSVMDGKFWIVGKFDGQTGAMAANPYKHWTARAAYDEAGRLAKVMPGSDFYVFQAHGAAHVPVQVQPPVQWKKF